MRTPRLTLLGKPGCHLCDDARAVVRGVIDQLTDGGRGIRIELEERSILDDAELMDRYSEEIPVVLIDDRVHNIWRIDADRLRAALQQAAAS